MGKYYIWLKLKKELLLTEKYLFICAVYIPPPPNPPTSQRTSSPPLRQRHVISRPREMCSSVGTQTCVQEHLLTSQIHKGTFTSQMKMSLTLSLSSTGTIVTRSSTRVQGTSCSSVRASVCTLSTVGYGGTQYCRLHDHRH